MKHTLAWVNNVTILILRPLYLVDYLDHVPVKIYQTSSNYVPWLSAETKPIMKERDEAKVRATKTGNQVFLRNTKGCVILSNSHLPLDKKANYKNIVNDKKGDNIWYLVYSIPNIKSKEESVSDSTCCKW